MSSATYRILPLDVARMLRPGTMSYAFHLEDSDSDETAMVDMPFEDFMVARGDLAEVVRELGRSLVVVLTQDEGRL